MLLLLYSPPPLRSNNTAGIGSSTFQIVISGSTISQSRVGLVIIEVYKNVRGLESVQKNSVWCGETWEQLAQYQEVLQRVLEYTKLIKMMHQVYNLLQGCLIPETNTTFIWTKFSCISEKLFLSSSYPKTEPLDLLQEPPDQHVPKCWYYSLE